MIAVPSFPPATDFFPPRATHAQSTR
jgi:hypothetical protein